MPKYLVVDPDYYAPRENPSETRAGTGLTKIQFAEKYPSSGWYVFELDEEAWVSDAFLSAFKERQNTSGIIEAIRHNDYFSVFDEQDNLLGLLQFEVTDFGCDWTC